jgi:putative ABC transport system permease protein
LIGIFAIMAMALALIGIAAALSYSVTTRQREIGIRMALGATSGHVVGGVLRSGLGIVLIGLAAGTVLTLVTITQIEEFLFQASLADPRFLVGAAVLLSLIGLMISLIPARRAAVTDPCVALRE